MYATTKSPNQPHRRTLPNTPHPLHASGHSTFPTQVPDLTLFNPFYPQPPAPSLSERSTSFHRKTPAIPLIPLNSTYAVPPRIDRVETSSVLHASLRRFVDFPSATPCIHDFHASKFFSPHLSRERVCNPYFPESTFPSQVIDFFVFLVRSSLLSGNGGFVPIAQP